MKKLANKNIKKTLPVRGRQRAPKTYYLVTIGCQMNQSDSERLAAFLDGQGMRQLDSWLKSDLVIINTCGVRQMAEDRVYGLVNQIRKENIRAQIVITGCLSRRPDVQKRLAGKVDLFLPINEMLELPNFFDGRIFQPYFSLDEVRLKQGERYLQIDPKHNSRFSAYVPIGNGCNNFCSYCVVPYARGREVYRPAADIIREVKSLVGSGYQEIILLAQNVNSYRSRDYDFSKLLARLIKIPGKFWLRFSSSHPKDMSSELIKIIASSDKICSHLHLAVQSGDDKILRAMNRNYTVAQYKRLIKQVRVARPEIAITTDVIVGFPGETKAQFENTKKLFREMDFDLAYIAQYSPRPGTVSAQMKDSVSQSEKKRRWQELNSLLTKSALKNNRAYLGREVEVLIEGKNRRGQYYGQTSSYKNVSLNAAPAGDLVGKFVMVQITKVFPFGLSGEFLSK